MNLLRLCLLMFLASWTSFAQAEDLKVFFGLMHGHTSYSDGLGDPDEAFAMGKAAKLDFMAVTEHNHNKAAGDDGVFLTPQLYGKLISSAKAHSKPGEFLAIWGQEVSTISAGNHANIFFADAICDMQAGDFKYLYETFLPAHTEIPFIQFNHPGVAKDQNPSTKKSERNNDYGIDDYDKDFKKLVAAAGKHTALIELIIGPAFSEATDMPHQNGKHQADYLFYLNQGFKLAPSAGQDNHFKTWGRATKARMGVWAKELTATAFIDAVQARRCYASEDNNAVVSFKINGAIMGSVITHSASASVNIQVTVKDPDEPDAKYKVQLYYDDKVGGDEAEIVEDASLSEDDSTATFTHIPKKGSYYFAKVIQKSGSQTDDIWTAPIWVGDSSFLPVPALANAANNTDDPRRGEISWDEATDYVGREVTVSGQVIRSFHLKNKVVFFNFDEDYENTLTLILLKSDFDNFGGEEGIKDLQKRLTKKVVRVKGAISLYQGERVQLRLSNPNQIIEVKDPPAENMDDE